MLISELIVRHLGPQGSVHLRGMTLTRPQLPTSTRAYQDGDNNVAPVAGDVVVASAPVGLGLRDHLDTGLPIGAHVLLLLAVEVTEIPVGRLLAAVSGAELQVVEATVISDTPDAMVAVVATRTDELVAPVPYLAQELEPLVALGPALLRRVLGEHVLEGLVHRARQRELLVQAEASVAEVTAELEELRAGWGEQNGALVRELDKASRELDLARREADVARRRAQALLTSRSFKVGARLARVWRLPRQVELSLRAKGLR